MEKKTLFENELKKLASLLTEAVAAMLTRNKITPIILCAQYGIFNSLPLLQS